MTDHAPSGAIRRLAAHAWERDPYEHYVEPAWVSRRLFQVETFFGTVVDPAAGFGTIVRSARSSGLKAFGYDIARRPEADTGLVTGGIDFTLPDGHPDLDDLYPAPYPVSCIVSNPPYGLIPDGSGDRLEEVFLRRALDRAEKVALLLPTSWLHSAKRARWVYSLPFCAKYELTPRPSIPPGHVILSGEKPGGGKKDFAWFIFWKGFSGAPKIARLDRDG